jgi:hypothetical protein
VDWLTLLDHGGGWAMALGMLTGLLTGKLLLPRELQPYKEALERSLAQVKLRDERIAQLERESRKLATDALEETRKQRESSKQEVAEIRKTMHELIGALSSLRGLPPDSPP